MAELQKKDMVEEGLSRLPSFWSDKPIARAFLQCNLEEIEKLYETLFQLNDERSIYTAVGYQLDVIGLLLNVPRDGLLDEDYRDILRSKASETNASGTVPDIKKVVRTINQASVVRVIPHYPAANYIFCNKFLSYVSSLAVEQANAAGVRARVSWYEGNDYFIPAHEHTFTESLLTDENGDPILVEEGGILYELSTGSSSQDEGYPGFTSLVPTPVGYEVIDGRGKLPSTAPVRNDNIQFGLLIDNDSNFIVDYTDKNIGWRVNSPDGLVP